MPTASVTHNFTAGTAAKASEVNTNFSDLVSTMNALDQDNFTTFTGVLAWNLVADASAITITSAGNKSLITLASTDELAASNSMLSIVTTVKQTLGDALVDIQSTNASSGLPAVRITDNGAAATGRSAALEINSTTKGVQMPRMTSVQRNAITIALVGEEIYNTDLKRKETYDGTYWRAPNSGSIEWWPATSLTLRPDLISCDGSTPGSTAHNAFMLIILALDFGGALPVQARKGIIGVGGSKPAGSDGPSTAVADTGGVEMITLSASETGVPTHGHASTLSGAPHTHTMFTPQDVSAGGTPISAGSHKVAHSFTEGAAGDPQYTMIQSTSAVSIGITSGTSASVLGGSVTDHAGTAATAHNNVSPSVVMTMCMVL